MHCGLENFTVTKEIIWLCTFIGKELHRPASIGPSDTTTQPKDEIFRKLIL